MKRLLRRFMRRFGLDIVRIAPGRDPLADMASFLKNDHPIIFDVGANQGQTVHWLRSGFPASTIHSFEPSPTTFQTLSQQTSHFKDVHLWNCALGSVPGRMKLLENEKSEMSSFLPLGESGWGQITRETEVDVKTIDQICDDQKIAHIDILKSDAQGFDLEVFKGAERMMQSNKVGLIFVEVTFSDVYEQLPSFGQLYDHLISRGFRLVSFYQFYYQNQLAGWTDALLVHKSLLVDKGGNHARPASRAEQAFQQH